MANPFVVEHAPLFCAHCGALVASLAKEFRFIVDQSEARIRALIEGQRVITENMTAALVKATDARDTSPGFRKRARHHA